MKKIIITISLLLIVLLGFGNNVNAIRESSGIENYLGKGVDVVKARYGNRYDLKPDAIFNSTWLNSQAYVTVQDAGNYQDFYYYGDSNIEYVYDQVKTKFNNVSSISGTDGVFSADVSIGFTQVSSNAFERYSSSYYHMFFSTYNTYTKYMSKSPYTYKSDYVNGLSSSFLTDLANLNNNTLDFETFFQRYGTHFIYNARYGASLMAYYSVSSNSVAFNSYLSSQLSTEVNAAYAGVVSGSNNSTIDVESIAALANQEYVESFSLKVMNGPSFSAYSFDGFKNGYNNWYNGISSSNSALIGYGDGGLVPLWKILPSSYGSEYTTGTLAYAMKQAFFNYAGSNFINFKDGYEPVSEIETEWSLVRSSERSVTGNAWTKNAGDTVNLTDKFADDLLDYNFDDLQDFGFTEVTIMVKWSMKEVNDGYQLIGLFDYEGASSPYYSEEFEHGGVGKYTTYVTYTISYVIPIEDLIETRPGDDVSICIDWMNRGWFADTFVTKNVYVSIIVTK